MIGWWARRRSLSVAGIRIRVHSVMRELQRQGCAADWFEPDQADRYRAVVLHKHYDADARRVATQLKTRGCRVIFDLCDNHFYNPRQLPEWDRRAAELRQMVSLADTVVVSTEALAAVVTQECGLSEPPTTVRDALDELADVPVPIKTRLRQWLPSRRLIAEVHASRNRGRTALLWFGNHGSPYADGGMLDLLGIRAELEALDQRLPLHLTVLSNNEAKFREHFGGWRFPVVYGTWSAHRFAAIAAQHSIALIPAQDNPFTQVKSENRVVTAFAHGLAVVADPIPSYRAFSDSLAFGDWASHIERYARDEDLRRQHVRGGLRRAQMLCGIQTIARQWREVIGA